MDSDNEKAGESLTGRRGPSFTRSEAQHLFTGRGEAWCVLRRERHGTVRGAHISRESTASARLRQGHGTRIGKKERGERLTALKSTEKERENWGGYRYPTSHCLRFSNKTKIPPTTAECLLATGVLRRPWEPPTLSLFEENSQGFPTILSNSLGVRYKAFFFSLFLACQDPSLLESGISWSNALLSLLLASPQRSQLWLSHLRWHSVSNHTRQPHGAQAEGKRMSSSLPFVSGQHGFALLMNAHSFMKDS